MPFMQVGNYPTRSFATLGPSELQPLFENVFEKNACTNLWVAIFTEQAPDFFVGPKSYVFVKQSPLFRLVNTCKVKRAFRRLQEAKKGPLPFKIV
tara:strand:+ start:1220 stop:1504 length:285 start_codon:yes stop_codon:yes gene_type:complete